MGEKSNRRIAGILAQVVVTVNQECGYDRGE